MTTTITTALGASPAFIQAGTGTTPGYSAIDVRRILFATPCQEGVVDAGSYMVTQRGAGANMSVDIAASTGNGAVVQGDAVTSQGLYFVSATAAVINEVISAADVTNPRIDQIVLEVEDDTHDAGGLNLARTRVVAGTATGGATLDNRTGAASLPSSALLLADVLVGAGVVSLANTVIRDRRPWARGANYTYLRTAGDYTITGTTYTAIDATNLKPRLECTGNLMTVSLRGRFYPNALTTVFVALYIDGVISTGGERPFTHTANTYSFMPALDWHVTPAAGSHTFEAWWKADGGAVWTLAGGTTQGAHFSVRETVAQNARNNSTTSG